ncbi:MAG: hypothetical protein ACJA1A_002224 [Saprospiraceae bacterium]|jgi:hypothetical protein
MKIYFLLIACLTLVFPSCSKEVEDKECEEYFEANEEIITGVWDWFPYERGDHKVEYADESGSTAFLTITRSERIEENAIGPIFKCPEVSVSPRLVVMRGSRTLFNAWAENVFFEDDKANAVFGISSAFGGGFSAITAEKSTIEDMHTAGKTVNIHGKLYEDIIVFIFTKDFTPVFFLYLQKGTGILAYEENGELIILKE